MGHEFVSLRSCGERLAELAASDRNHANTRYGQYRPMYRMAFQWVFHLTSIHKATMAARI